MGYWRKRCTGRGISQVRRKGVSLEVLWHRMLVGGQGSMHHRDNAKPRAIKHQLKMKCEGQRAADKESHLPGYQKS